MSDLDKECFRLNSQKEGYEEASEKQMNYMWEEYELTYNHAKELRNETLTDLALMKKKIQELKNEIRKLGSVNVNAIEDYKNVSERYTFLKGQHDDLVEAEASLEQIIEELDVAMRKQFTEQFSRIATEFNDVFRQLFGGGKGSLELQEDVDILEAGIRIIAQPPGKKQQNMMQLSGGEKQKIACAGVSIMKPDIFVLDEPSSNLDAASIMDLRRIIAHWKEQGKTIIISEHRLYYLRGLADRFIYMKEGQIIQDYSATEFENLTEEKREEMGLRAYVLENLLMPEMLISERTTMELHDFNFAYKNGPQILYIRECEIPANRIVAITGNNGAGKSTFSRCFCGLEKQCGTIIWNGKTYRPKERLKACYMVMQEVNHQLFTETIQDEVMISMKEENEKEADKFLDMLDLIKVKDRHPMSLSGGQKQRAAIASAIASGRSVLFLDEPTSGLDHKHMLEVAEVLREVWDTGISVYVITHDLELIIECCTDVIHFENGTIADQYQMDAEGMEKIRKYFIQEKCCGKWSKSD